MNIFESPPEIQPVGSLPNTLQHPEKTYKPRPKLPDQPYSRPLHPEGAMSSICHCLGCVVTSGRRRWPPAPVSLCYLGLPLASCQPCPFSASGPHLCSSVRLGDYCRAYGGCGLQILCRPAGHGGASLGDCCSPCCGCWCWSAPGCCGSLPARPPWSYHRPAIAYPSCCPTC